MPRIIVTRYSKYYVQDSTTCVCFSKKCLPTSNRQLFSFMTTPGIFRQSRTKVVGKVVQLNSISAAFIQRLLMFNKNNFSSPKYPPSPLFNVGIQHKQSNSSVLYNIEKGGWGREAKERSKVLTFPTLLTMIVVMFVCIRLYTVSGPPLVKTYKPY